MKSEKKHRTVHTHEFKVEAVKLTLQGDRSVQEVADNLGIHISNLRRWKKPTWPRSITPSLGKADSRSMRTRCVVFVERWKSFARNEIY